MRSSFIVAAVASFVLLSATGCGLDEEHSAQMWRSIQSSLGKTSGHGQALTASFDFDVDCARDGSASLTATLDTSHLANSVEVLFGYDVRYNECQPDENTLDGELHYAASVDAGSSDLGAAVAVRYVYEGSVTSTGETNGTCDIDVVGTVNASAGRGPGDEFSSSVDIDYDGSICGHDAHEALSARADLGD